MYGITTCYKYVLLCINHLEDCEVLAYREIMCIFSSAGPYNCVNLLHEGANLL